MDFVVLIIFLISFKPLQGLSCPCSFVPCTSGTYKASSPNVSICNLAKYFAFDQGAFLENSIDSLDPLRPFLRDVRESPPTQSSQCLFSSGCAYLNTSGFEVSSFRISDRAGFSVCLWYLVGTERSKWQRLFDFGDGPISNNILLSRFQCFHFSNYEFLVVSLSEFAFHD